jgi:hypothetical protein
MNAQTEQTRFVRFRPTVAGRLVIAWLIVGVPLAWGVWQVFVKSLDLFR